MHILYSFSLKKLILVSGFLVVLLFLFTRTTHASTLASASATLTTSRPSPSTPLLANQAASDSILDVADNKSFFLASDSARLFADTGQAESYVTVASMSATGIPSANHRTVYLATTTATTHHNGTTVAVPVTAMHTISFTTQTAIPAGGYILITYPGAANNTASPSASGFAFNNLNFSGTWASANVKTNGITCNNTSTITSPTIKCFTTAGVSANTLITFLIGCSAATGPVCTTQAPSLINPTKAATAGNADIWKVSIITADSGNVQLDTASIAMGTVESVTVRANIDPSLTFTISGIANGTLLSGVATGCSQADTTNAGIASTTTEVSLGTLSLVPTSNDVTIGNIAAQQLTVATNGSNGYSITATSSGPLKNPANGFFVNSNTTPQAFPTTGHYFGVHACGFDTDLTKWSTTVSTACNTYRSGSTNPVCKYAWPTTTSPLLIAQNNTGTIGSGAPCFASGCGNTVVSYAATQDVSLPPGIYQTVITYVATPSF